MNFADPIFIPFLVVALSIFWMLNKKSSEASKFWALGISLFFYGFWFPPGLILIFYTIILNYSLAPVIVRTKSKLPITMGLIFNLLPLVFFKYAVFLCETFLPGGYLKPDSILSDLILPLGISFYTFQGMSYLMDVSRGNVKVARFIDFSVYLTFFPQLVAGPIIRSKDFLPQLSRPLNQKEKEIEWAIYRIMRGFFLKLVIADNLSPTIDTLYSLDPQSMDSGTAWLAGLLFGIQIFCDFAGYSEIAIGTGKLFGFKIPENFKNPYFARNIGDFWRRWHISLMEWFRDYVYIPLGGNRHGYAKQNRNILIVFLLSGLWHGAAWKFIVWGGLHGAMVMASHKLSFLHKKLPTALNMMVTFVIVIFLWIPFRAYDLDHTFSMWHRMLFTVPSATLPVGILSALPYLALFCIHLLFDHTAPNSQNCADKKVYINTLIKICLYFGLILISAGESSDFIYFQF